ncbi:MAG: ATP-binding protein [Actinobacteria bacterium]|nr:ATP-binding protein [Actinomycetota bacterium]
MTPLTTCLDLSFQATPSSVRKARAAVGEVVSGLVRDKRLVDDVRLCVSEAVSNVVRHAYGTRRGAVDVRVEREDAELAVVVRDDGMGLRASGGRGKAGGFGLKIIERVASQHTIETKPKAGTVIRMVFALDPPAYHSSDG